MDAGPAYEILAHIDVAPREFAKTDFTEVARSDRALRAKLRSLHRDGYETIVRLPSGRRYPGSRFPEHSMMDDDLGYAPKPEYAHLMHFVEGTWILRDE
jgi:hypothetical protein